MLCWYRLLPEISASTIARIKKLNALIWGAMILITVRATRLLRKRKLSKLYFFTFCEGFMVLLLLSFTSCHQGIIMTVVGRENALIHM